MASQSAARIVFRSATSTARRSHPSSLRNAARTFCTNPRVSEWRRHLRTPILQYILPAPRNFQTSSRYNGILGEDSEPTKTEESEVQKPTQRTEIELADFHRLSDYFMEDLQRKLEQRQEEKGDLDVEYSVRCSHGSDSSATLTLLCVGWRTKH